jgi:hypothetical protein
MLKKNLLTFQNAKTSKGEDMGYLTAILYLAPADMVEGLNLCPFASAGCKKACLFSAGRGKFSNVKDARIAKTLLFRDNLNTFMYNIVRNIRSAIKKAKRLGLTPVVRLNGTSDIRWENVRSHNGKNIFELFPSVQFYDYTKDFKRTKALHGRWSNYHLTFSLSEGNKKHALELLALGVNVAVVFRDALPTTWEGFEVTSGDKHDLRFLDKKGGYVIGLKAKGDAKKDTSGFVQESNENKKAV